jgi:DNA-directed RNA polymerase specialized sigma subunit
MANEDFQAVPVASAPNIEANNAVIQAVNTLQQVNVTIQNIQVKPNQVIVTGYNPEGTVTIIQQSNNGYTSKSLSTYIPSTIEKRREVVSYLRSQNMTQQDIAQRLGVSQKTISNDLKVTSNK